MDLTELLRPRSLERVTGQTDVKELIKTSLSNNNFPKISLFCGDTGTGKSTLAEIVGLGLTCEAPLSTGEPCLQCPTCKNNIKALERGQTTDSMVKVNIGLASSKQDVKDLIKEIFVLQSRPEGNSVYILEEMHAMKNEQDQIPLLEEFMHVPEGVYIIMCTTKKFKLIPELRGRATEFNLNRPSEEECLTLVEDICDALSIGGPPLSVQKKLVRKCKNTPREIVKIIDLLSKGGTINEDLARRYLGDIDPDLYIQFFDICLSPEFSLTKFVNYIEQLQVDKVNFIRGLREFIMDTAICLWGSNVDHITRGLKQKMSNTFYPLGEEGFLKLLSEVRRFNLVNDESDVNYELFNLCQYLRGRDSSKAIKESHREATKNKIKGERVVHQKVQSKIVEDNKEMNEDDIFDFLGSTTEYEV